MALDTRRCFWFGTEEKAQFFATPLKGADSSPSAWGVDGTLLNGGGYAFNSFGSHKRYNYEWPQSSSPETAQMMKSYRDGTYGRGLLYFLEPGIYRTNILPAHWADPSMSLNNEAPSLVYGVDPIAVPTSGGDHLNLPINSAQYDLSNTPPQAVPTPDSSVFLPVPTGHTLFLGAFYTATGTGGVFATPVNSNGSFGTTVRLTEKSNSDTEVVIDRFEGDINGVRLWVGRTDGTASSVTIAAMAGRLMETSDTVTYGPWTVSSTNLVPNPVPASTTGWSALTGATISLLGGTIQVATPGVSANEGVQVLTASRPPHSISGGIMVNAPAGASLYLQARPNSSATGAVQTNFTGTGGWQFVKAEATGTPAAASGHVVMVRTASTQAITFSVRQAIIEEAVTLSPYFDGNLPGDDLNRYTWTGTANASPSTHETRTRTGSPTKQAKLVAGPWIGGQGHSGCRFVGTPSYVNNGPVEGGRVGFAASFVEVGSWVYG